MSRRAAGGRGNILIRGGLRPARGLRVAPDHVTRPGTARRFELRRSGLIKRRERIECELIPPGGGRVARVGPRRRGSVVPRRRQRRAVDHRRGRRRQRDEAAQARCPQHGCRLRLRLRASATHQVFDLQRTRWHNTLLQRCPRAAETHASIR